MKYPIETPYLLLCRLLVGLNRKCLWERHMRCNTIQKDRCCRARKLDARCSAAVCGVRSEEDSSLLCSGVTIKPTTVIFLVLFLSLVCCTLVTISICSLQTACYSSQHYPPLSISLQIQVPSLNPRGLVNMHQLQVRVQ